MNNLNVLFVPNLFNFTNKYIKMRHLILTSTDIYSHEGYVDDTCPLLYMNQRCPAALYPWTKDMDTVCQENIHATSPPLHSGINGTELADA
jgi:hypothetical protein